MQKESFKQTNSFTQAFQSFWKKKGKKTKPLTCMQTNFATMSKRLIFPKHTCKWKNTQPSQE